MGDVCFSNNLSSVGDDDKSMINSDAVAIGTDVVAIGIGIGNDNDDASSFLAADPGLESSIGFGNSGSGGWMGSDVAIGASTFGSLFSVFLFSLKLKTDKC